MREKCDQSVIIIQVEPHLPQREDLLEAVLVSTLLLGNVGGQHRAHRIEIVSRAVLSGISEEQQSPRRARVVQRVPGSLYDASVRTRLSQPRADPDRCSPRSMGTFIINDDQQRAHEHAEAPNGRGGSGGRDVH